MKISILLPYKENFSPIYAGAVSLFVKDTTKISKFKKFITIYGSTNLKPINYNEPTFMQPKLDGVRCVIQANVKRHILHPSLNDVSVVAYSRTGKEWKNIDHILFNLQPFFKFHPQVVLDGELYNHDLRDDF